jgi:hypothetical protein
VVTLSGKARNTAEKDGQPNSQDIRGVKSVKNEMVVEEPNSFHSETPMRSYWLPGHPARGRQCKYDKKFGFYLQKTIQSLSAFAAHASFARSRAYLPP